MGASWGEGGRAGVRGLVTAQDVERCTRDETVFQGAPGDPGCPRNSRPARRGNAPRCGGIFITVVRRPTLVDDDNPNAGSLNQDIGFSTAARNVSGIAM